MAKLLRSLFRPLIVGLGSEAGPSGAAAWTPYTGAAIDMDFVAQRYWWGGSEKTTANFTTYVLSGSTFGANGLTPTGTMDITLALAGLGTFTPGSFAGALTMTAAAPSGVRPFWQLDDTTVNERINVTQSTTPLLALGAVAVSVAQCNITVAGSGTLAVRHGFAGSYATNDFKDSCDGVAGTADVLGTLPTVTTLRIGRLTTTNSQPSGSIGRVLLFTSVKTQAALDALSVALRDNVVI